VKAVRLVDSETVSSESFVKGATGILEAVVLVRSSKRMESSKNN
jgi:hypothetical protein